MIGIRWNPRREWNLYANVATAFETPTTTELDNPSGGGFKTGLTSQTALILRPLEGLVAEFSYTYSRFRYATFIAPNGDFSGNALPGIPEHFGNLRLSYDHPSGWFGIWNTRVVGPLYADDANTTRIGGYSFSDLRLGWSRAFGSWELEGFAGMNNLFAEDYAANVRINAFGGRLYEPAPERNATAGIRVRYILGD